jgi:protein-tyrosine-phosphatase
MGQRCKLKLTRVLFVCFGNSCRSPIAAGLAMKILGDLAVYESTGISPGDLQANANANAICHARDGNGYQGPSSA